MKTKVILSLLISSALLFTACSDDEAANPEEDIQIAGLVTYEGNDFSLKMPQDWEIIEKNSFTSNVPVETVVDFRNNLKSEIFTANINLSMVAVPETQNSEDFAKSSLAQARNSLVAFTEIAQREESVGILVGFVTEFSGKKTALEEKIQFKQLSVVQNGVGYSLTASFLPKEDIGVVELMDAMISSFALL
jgi:hypothetical protein